MHRIIAIIDAIEAQLKTIPSIEVIRNRTLDPTTYPAVGVRMGNEEEIDRDAQEQIFALDILTQIYVNAAQSKDLDSDLLSIRSSIHQAIKSQRNLAKSYVDSVTLQGQQDPVFTNIGDKPTGVLTLLWRVVYRSPLNNPEE